MEMNITIILIAITSIISLVAFQKHQWIERLIFYPYLIWRNKEWYRMLTGGLIHLDLTHLFFNMFVLYSFGSYIEVAFGQIFGEAGGLIYAAMYLLAIVLADVWNLFKKRDDPNYRSLGASGGVAAVLFSFILIKPFGLLYLFFIPIGIPAFIFGGLYLAYSIYMAKRQSDNIGHLAHFTGAIFGFFFPVLLQPSLLIRFVQTLIGQ
ncbi:MAG: rhomboid family intramembrane serine protease [Bacteroidetes bacterium]|nr:rhomboid family intramembrane serine protease [Bacteroidota bacterium]